VGKNDDGDAIGLEHAVDFAESLGKHLLKSAHGVFRAACSAGVGHHFLGLWRERRSEKVGVKIANRALEPDVEKVRKVAVRHVVVIRWIGQHSVEEVVWPGKGSGGAL
jgi:hypothetical protein